MPQNLDGLPRFRKMTRADEHVLYDLYHASIPENVREAEAATFREWKAAQDRSWLVGKVSQQVAERDGIVRACFRSSVDGGAGHFDLLVHPSEPAQRGAPRRRSQSDGRHAPGDSSARSRVGPDQSAPAARLRARPRIRISRHENGSHSKGSPTSARCLGRQPAVGGHGGKADHG